MILLTIFLDVRIDLKKYLWRVVNNVLIYICPSSIFLTLLLHARFHQNCHAPVGCCKY